MGSRPKCPRRTHYTLLTLNDISQIRFKISVLASSLYHYNDVYILVKRILTVENKVTQSDPNNVANKKVILKNCESFTNRMSIINNTEVDDPHDIYVLMPMYS